MNEIVIAVIIVSAIGIIAGVGLSLASEFFAVKKNETEEKIRECLPGANCGACGYTGCDGYAKAVADGSEERMSLCGPGGADAAGAIAAVMGRTADRVVPTAAMVMCGGDCEKAESKLQYAGVQSCKAAAQLFGGYKSCLYGCLGYGDCAEACPYDAIFICDGIAHVNTIECKACRKCTTVCPKGIIRMVPLDTPRASVLCRNIDKGAQTRRICSVGCIGCGKCAKVCENGAVSVTNFLAEVDYEKCTGCGKCAEACPVKCIELIRGRYRAE